MIVLIICNLLLVVWQLFFIDDLGSNFKVNDNWWGKHSRIQRYFLLDQFFSEEKAKGDFVDFIDRQRFSTFFMSMFLLNMLFNAVTAFYFLLCLAAKIAGHLATVDISRGWKFLYVQLVINLVLSLVFAEWTHKYVRLHHLRRLQLFLDFFVPTDKFIWQFVSVEYPSKK